MAISAYRPGNRRLIPVSRAEKGPSPTAKIIQDSMKKAPADRAFMPVFGVHPQPLTPRHPKADGKQTLDRLFIDGDKPDFLVEISGIGRTEGFSVTPVDLSFSRDGMLPLPDGTVLVTFPVSDPVWHRYIDMAKVVNHGAFRVSKREDFSDAFFGTTDANRQKQSVLLAERQGRRVRPSRFFFEGGNVFITRDRTGKPAAVIGEDNVLMTQAHYRENGGFASEPHQSRIQALKADLPRLSSSQKREILKVLKSERKQSGRSPAAREPEIRQFQAEQAYICQHLIPEDLGIPAEQCTVVPQPHYHLDMLMMAGREGRFFVNNYEAGTAFLNFIIDHRESFHLNKDQVATVNTYRLANQKLAREQAPLMQQLKSALLRGNFEVTDAPAVFFDKEEDGSFDPPDHVNFINGIMGESTPGSSFFIVPGTRVDPPEGPATVSEVLMSGFRQFMSQYVGTTYFAGMGLDEDFEAAHLLVNDKWAGTHCISISFGTTPSNPAV